MGEERGAVCVRRGAGSRETGKQRIPTLPFFDFISFPSNEVLLCSIHQCDVEKVAFLRIGLSAIHRSNTDGE